MVVLPRVRLTTGRFGADPLNVCADALIHRISLDRKTTDGREQQCYIHWLGEMRMKAEVHRVSTVFVPRVRGEGDRR